MGKHHLLLEPLLSVVALLVSLLMLWVTTVDQVAGQGKQVSVDRALPVKETTVGLAQIIKAAAAAAARGLPVATALRVLEAREVTEALLA